MMHRIVLFLPSFWFCFMSTELPLRGADEARPSPDKQPAATEQASTEKWALAVHGGAGGDSETWSQEKRAARLAGLERALRAGKDMLAGGASALETVEQVIRIFEDDSHFNAGRGAVLTTTGHAELDASIMDGRAARCGAVGGVTTARNPITLARLVMTETPHVLLVGPGADQFAAEQAAAGRIERVTPDYFLSRLEARRNEEVAPRSSPPTSTENDETHFGTVGCVVRDLHGNLAAGTSTGGTTNKLPGRIGDSPIVGAGTYAANQSCAVSGTGVGEEFIRNAVAYDIAAQMRYAGRTLDDAVTRVMQDTLQPGVGGLIAVDRNGRIVMQHNTPGMSCGAADSDGRFDVQLTLKVDASDPQ